MSYFGLWVVGGLTPPKGILLYNNHPLAGYVNSPKHLIPGIHVNIWPSSGQHFGDLMECSSYKMGSPILTRTGAVRPLGLPGISTCWKLAKGLLKVWGHFALWSCSDLHLLCSWQRSKPPHVGLPGLGRYGEARA